MRPITRESLAQDVELADQLHAGRETLVNPQDLPGRFGRVVRAVDRVLEAIGSEGLLAGGWAVWRHGYPGRLTQDLDVVIPAEKIEEFLRAAAFAGFQVPPSQPGRWPKAIHKETGIKVDLLPEGERPGTPKAPAPTTIPSPAAMGATKTKLEYIPLAFLIELKLAAGRERDYSDVVELMRANAGLVEAIRLHLKDVHSDYVREFDRLVNRAREQGDD